MKLRILLGLTLILGLHAGFHAVPAVQAPAPAMSCDVSVQPALDADASLRQCIPCAPNLPCKNPLTVCVYVNSSHGCCLGYAN